MRKNFIEILNWYKINFLYRKKAIFIIKIFKVMLQFGPWVGQWPWFLTKDAWFYFVESNKNQLDILITWYIHLEKLYFFKSMRTFIDCFCVSYIIHKKSLINCKSVQDISAIQVVEIECVILRTYVLIWKGNFDLSTAKLRDFNYKLILNYHERFDVRLLL